MDQDLVRPGHRLTQSATEPVSGLDVYITFHVTRVMSSQPFKGVLSS